MRKVCLGVSLLLACAAHSYAVCIVPIEPCPDKPNCIATDDANPDRRAPTISFDGTANEHWSKVRTAVLALDRVAIVEEREHFLHATLTSALMGYVDDLVVTVCDDGKRLGVRSSSRKGYWDLGVNSRRVETLIERLRDSGAVR